MEKLDKEALADDYVNTNVTMKDWSEAKKAATMINFEKGLGYAENHYLAKLQEQQDIIAHQGKSLLRIGGKLQTAKELLKYIKINLGAILFASHTKVNKEIEEFLKQ